MSPLQGSGATVAMAQTHPSAHGSAGSSSRFQHRARGMPVEGVPDPVFLRCAVLSPNVDWPPPVKTARGWSQVAAERLQQLIAFDRRSESSETGKRRTKDASPYTLAGQQFSAQGKAGNSDHPLRGSERYPQVEMLHSLTTAEEGSRTFTPFKARIRLHWVGHSLADVLGVATGKYALRALPMHATSANEQELRADACACRGPYLTLVNGGLNCLSTSYTNLDPHPRPTVRDALGPHRCRNAQLPSLTRGCPRLPSVQGTRVLHRALLCAPGTEGPADSLRKVLGFLCMCPGASRLFNDGLPALMGWRSRQPV